MAAALLAGCAMRAEDASPAGARPADSRVALRAPDGSQRGTVSVIQTHGSLLVRVEGVNLPPGVHGAHIHSVGRCDAPDFASAGPHWNPSGRQHGRDNPAGAHLGDLPNLTVGANGRGELEFDLPGGWVRRGATPMLDADGASFVIHAAADDYRSDPSGNSGARIACAVLR
jgi:Cu-Zn family superoxide dismutase